MPSPEYSPRIVSPSEMTRMETSAGKLSPSGGVVSVPISSRAALSAVKMCSNQRPCEPLLMTMNLLKVESSL